MELKKTYKQMTNVDIEEQKQLWNERGKGYYGEFLVFEHLYRLVNGNCKILMNLNIPVDNKKTTEVDLMMIHETGIYVFEIKHYKGTIYGTETDNMWTQYFRTTKNQVFKNPVLQNDYHVEAVKRLFPDVTVKSVIVFTHDDCEIKINRKSDDIIITTLHNLWRNLEFVFDCNVSKYNMNDIDKMFDEVYKYSALSDEVLIDGESKSFVEWLHPSINNMLSVKSNYETESLKLISKEKELKKTKIIGVVCNVIIAILCIICLGFSINSVKKDYDDKLELFKQNFKHVDEIGNEYIDMINEFVDVSNVSLENIGGSGVTFLASISMNNDLYGMALTQESKYIVMTIDGKVFEYDVFGEHLAYNRYSNMLGKGIRVTGNLKSAQFYGVTKDNISYIKITNIELFKLDVMKTIVKDNLELEVYKK